LCGEEIEVEQQIDVPTGDNRPVTEAERLMLLFVHDLRAPLGVATGYLRLLQDGRLGGELDQGLALTRTLDALGRIASLCDAMSESTERMDARAASGRLAPEDLVGRVVSALKSPVAIEVGRDWDPRLSVAVGRDGDRFARALALIIGLVARRSPSAAVRVVPGDGTVRFVLNRRDGNSAEAVRFDPWRGFGLEAVLACQAIEVTGGSIRTGGDADLTIDLPLIGAEAP
jgi:signal transduction histidine kinase